MQTIENRTVADIAAGSLAAVRVFERLGIEYCCGGRVPLSDVCRNKGLVTEDVQRALDDAAISQPADHRDWTKARLTDLIAHIVSAHHDYLKRELGPLGERVMKVERVYGSRANAADPVTGLSNTFQALATELLWHLHKEERMLFPAIEMCETAAIAGEPGPWFPFGKVANPIRMMETEHDNAGDGLARLRQITRDFEIPEYACVTYKAMIAGLRELEEDLHMHIHLENNILFPRAIQLEGR